MSSTAFIKTWNIHNKGKKYKDIQNRTNNGLERYNRHLNQKFPTPHPSLLIFVSALQEEARAQVQGLENIRYGKEIPNDLDEVSVWPIPEFYKNFVPWFFIKMFDFVVEIQYMFVPLISFERDPHE